MSTNRTGDTSRVDPFAPKGKIEMDQLPLADLKRYILGSLEIEKAQVPVQSVPIFGVERGSFYSITRNVGNQTLLAAATTWTTFTSRVRGNISLSGLRDLDVWMCASACVAAAGTAFAFSFTLDGVEFQRMVLGQAANSGYGVRYQDNAPNVEGWAAHGKVPANLLERKVYEIEAVYRCTTGANNGTLYRGAAEHFILNALEQ